MAKEMQYHHCSHCKQLFPPQKLQKYGKLNLFYCKNCASNIVKCRYCGDEIIPEDSNIPVCVFCFDAKSRTCIRCGHDFLPERRHYNTCPNCYNSKKVMDIRNESHNSDSSSISRIDENVNLDADIIAKAFMDSEIQSQAIEFFSLRGLEAVNPLIECFDDKNNVVQKYAIDTLVLIGEKAVDPLIDGLEYINDQIRYNCIKALGKIQDKKAVEPLINILIDDDEPKVRAIAATAIGNLKDINLINYLIESLESDKSSYVRAAAANGIGNFDDNKALKSLIKAMDDENKYVVEASVASIQKIEGPQFVEELIKSKTDKIESKSEIDEYIEHRHIVMEELIEKIDDSILKKNIQNSSNLYSVSSDEFVFNIINNIETSSEEDKIVLIDILGETANSNVIDPLINLLGNEDNRIRWAAKESLGKIALKHLNKLVEYLDHENEDIRFVIVYILTEIDDSRVIDHLLRALYDDDPDIRYKSLNFLSTKDDEKVLLHVGELVNDDVIGLRIAAIKLLGKKGGVNEVDNLIVALSDDDFKVRKEAETALLYIKKRIDKDKEIKKIENEVSKKVKNIKEDIIEPKNDKTEVKSKNPMRLLNDLR